MDDGVEATLNYVAPASARNRLYVAPGGHMTTTKYAPATVSIHDARPHVADFGLDRSGFTLLRHHSAVTGFRYPAQLDTVYADEVAALVKSATGADEVVSLGWVLRTSADQIPDGVQPLAPDRHVDVHPGRADARMEGASPRPRQRYQQAILTRPGPALHP